MKNEKGKLTFLGLLMIIVVVYGVFAAIKHFSTVFEKSQIATEVFDAIGLIRGGSFTEEEGVSTIRSILMKKDIIFNEKDTGAVEVYLDDKKGKIEYYFRYSIETDFIFWKRVEVVEVEDGMLNYT